MGEEEEVKMMRYQKTRDKPMAEVLMYTVPSGYVPDKNMLVLEGIVKGLLYAMGPWWVSGLESGLSEVASDDDVGHMVVALLLLIRDWDWAWKNTTKGVDDGNVVVEDVLNWDCDYDAYDA